MKFLKDGAIILVLTGVLFLGFEGCLRIFSPQESRHEYLSEKRGASRDAVLGHVNTPGAHYRTSHPEFTAEYLIDDSGFRHDGSPNLESDSLKTILILGDSFTFGAGVNYEETWPSVFERNIKTAGQFRVINAGVPGYDTRTELIYLERLYSQIQPDVVILAFLPNDVFTNKPVDRDRLRNQSEKLSGQIMVEKQDKPATFHTIVFFKRLLMGGDGFYTQLYNMTPSAKFFAVSPQPEIQRQFEISKALIAEMNRFCQTQNTPFLTLSIPQQFQTLVAANQLELDGIDVHQMDRNFSQFANQEKFVWIETLPALAKIYKQNKVDLYFRYDGHLTQEGNAAVGKLLAERFFTFLSENDHHFSR